MKKTRFSSGHFLLSWPSGWCLLSLLLLGVLGMLAANAQAAISVQGSQSNYVQQGSAVTSLTITKPASVADSDVMIASIAVRGSSATITAPAGWTLIANLDSQQALSNTFRMRTYYRVVATAASEPASYTWNFSGAGNGVVGGIVLFRGVDNTTPIDAPAAATVALLLSASVVAPSVTPVTANAMLVTAYGLGGSNATWTPPTNMTEQVDRNSAGTKGSRKIAMEMDTQALTTAVATGTRTATASASGYGVGQSLVLRPAPVVCAANPSGSVINTYYPATASVASGATSIVLGAASGAATPIAAGDTVLIVQVQDATIATTNGSGYGAVSGTPAAGSYEYRIANNNVPTTGGTLTLTSGLGNAYTYQAGSNAVAQKTFQVIRVPTTFSGNTMTLSNTQALPWNGSVGGVVAFDVLGTLNLNGATVNVSGQGFRGGGARTLAGAAGYLNTDYVTPATVNANGAKGEGIAGTPRFVYNSALVRTDTGVEGYPNGSQARGAPANGGGGGTDGDPPANDQNSGGGGGGNGGGGGIGGIPWCSTFSASNPPYYNCPDGSHPNNNFNSGGLGGAAFSSFGTCKLTMGGGGGSGTNNNGTGAAACDTGQDGACSSGAAGGGLIIVRAAAMTGSGNFCANGASGDTTVQNDGSGGGGAGGAVLVYAGSGMGGLTIGAMGGSGGSNNPGATSPHGPGGGGGGGYVRTSAAPAACAVTGGSAGVTYNQGVLFGSYGAAAGIAGSCVNTSFSDTACGGYASSSSAAANFNIIDGYMSSYNSSCAGGSCDIYTKLAGTPFTLDIIALKADGTLNTTYGAKTVTAYLVDNSDHACGSDTTRTTATCTAAACINKLASPVTSQSVSFLSSDNGYKQNQNFTVNNAYRELIAIVKDTNSSPTVYGCSTDSFSVRPSFFSLSATTTGGTPLATSASGATGTPTVAAGTSFTLNINSNTVNYDGTPAIDYSKVTDFVSGGTVSSGLTPVGADTAALYSSINAASAATGNTTGTLKYSNVGYFSFAAGAVSDATYTAVDAADGDCIANSGSYVLVSGKYGCNITSSSALTGGRFIPDHFKLTGNIMPFCAVATPFAYMDQPLPLNFTLLAKDANDNTTTNYAGSYAKLAYNSPWTPSGDLSTATVPFWGLSALDDAITKSPLLSRVAVTTNSSDAWSGGSYTSSASVAISRSAPPDGPYTAVKFGLYPKDSDGVTLRNADLNLNADANSATGPSGNERQNINNASYQASGFAFRYGRLRMFNAYGSELLPLTVPVQAEYYTGSGWKVNADDGSVATSCTVVPAGASVIGNATCRGTGCTAPSVCFVDPNISLTSCQPTDLTLVGGSDTLTLYDSNRQAGNVDLAIDLGYSATADVSCNSQHPAGATPGGAPWLQYAWCSGKLDPAARATFGIYKSPIIYFRENY